MEAVLGRPVRPATCAHPSLARTLHGKVVRGLTLWRPWPWSIVVADKRVENRSWRPPDYMIGQYLALHAGRKYDEDAAAAMRAGRFTEQGKLCPISQQLHPHSCIVGLATLAGWHTPRPAAEPWAFGPIVWELDDVIRLHKPIPCRGAQGLWPLPESVLDQLEAVLDAA